MAEVLDVLELGRLLGKAVVAPAGRGCPAIAGAADNRAARRQPTRASHQDVPTRTPLNSSSSALPTGSRMRFSRTPIRTSLPGDRFADTRVVGVDALVFTLVDPWWTPEGPLGGRVPILLWIEKTADRRAHDRVHCYSVASADAGKPRSRAELQ